MFSAWAPLQTEFGGEVLASRYVKDAARAENHNTGLLLRGCWEVTRGLGSCCNI